MSHGVQDNKRSDEVGTSLGSEQSHDSNTGAEDLADFVASLTSQVNLTESKLEVVEMEKSSLQSTLDHLDVLETPVVKNLIKSYQHQVESLKKQLDSMKQIKPDVQLVQRIDILSNFNSKVMQQNIDMSGKLQNAETEINDLQNELALLKSAQSASGEDSEVKSKEEIAFLQKHLAQNYAMYLSCQKNNQEKQDTISIQKMENEKLLNQIEVLRHEKDDLELYIRAATCSQRGESNATAIAADMNLHEMDKHSIENIVHEGDQLKKQLDVFLETQPFEGGATAICTSNSYEPIMSDTTNLSAQNESLKEHINEQEAKIEKLHIRCDDYEQQIGELQMKCEQRGMKIEELEKKVDDSKKKLDTKNPDEDSNTKIYQEQLKAFQDDFQAEREEKQRFMRESRQLKDENVNLKHELQSQLSTQFSSPPPLSYEANAIVPGLHPNQGFAFSPQMGYHDQGYPIQRGPQTSEFNTTQSSTGQPHVSGISNNQTYEQSNIAPQVRHCASYTQMQNVPHDYYRLQSQRFTPNYSIPQGEVQHRYVHPSNTFHEGVRSRAPTHLTQISRTQAHRNMNPQLSPPIENLQDRRPQK